MAENKGSTILRKNVDDLKNHFFRTLAQMMTEIEHEDDINAWYEAEDEDVREKEDPSSIASESLYRISCVLGEATVLKCTSSLLKQAI